MTGTANTDELWTSLEKWGRENAPNMLEDLNPGASDEELSELQTALGLELPAAFLQSLKVHDGESDGWPSKVFADMGAYLGCARIAEIWQMHLQIADQVGDDFSDEDRAEQIRDGIIFVEGPVRPQIFDAGWVPIMDCNGDVFWALDFAPAEGGVPGQVIRVDLESCEWTVVAGSFEEFLASYVKELKAGEYQVAEGHPTKRPVDYAGFEYAQAVSEAFKAGTTNAELATQAAGSVAEVVGLQIGKAESDSCHLQISDSTLQLSGSLHGAAPSHVLRVKIRVGKRRGMGLLGAKHEIISWEVVNKQSEGGQNVS